jgi:hypothetical protein
MINEINFSDFSTPIMQTFLILYVGVLMIYILHKTPKVIITPIE